ncbi:ABC transporter substrate-binding protein [Aquisalimonas asiatica]|nr:ABC transporter substrate-binding protein [Aquisalimonas asiatica]
MNRRKFLQRAALFGAGAAVVPQIDPSFFLRSALASRGAPMVFLAAENMTGNWDPTSHTNLAQMNLESMVFGTLTRAPMTEEDPSEIRYELATGMELLDDHTLEVTLRDGVVFHNGASFTAADVKATYEYGSRSDRPAAWHPGRCEVEVVDDYTARIHTSGDDFPASMYILLSSFLPILSAADIEDGSISDRPNGTGPFKYVERRGNDTTLEAFDDYFAGTPQLSGIRYSFVGDSSSRLLALMNGEADVIERLEPEQLETLRGRGGVKINKMLSVENKYLWFRCSKPPFDNELLRLAACHAIDHEQVLAIMGEAAQESRAHISPVKFGYADLDAYPQFDPERCQQLLSEAGYPRGEGLPELEYITSIGFYPKTQEYGELITAMLQAQGFPVTMNVMEVAAWNDAYYHREGGGPGHMVDGGWATGSPEPDLVLRTHFHSSSRRVCGIQDDEIDAALDRERNEPDLDKRERIIQEETLPLIARKAPAHSLFTSVFMHAMREDVDGLFLYPNGQLDASETAIS